MDIYNIGEKSFRMSYVGWSGVGGWRNFGYQRVSLGKTTLCQRMYPSLLPPLSLSASFIIYILSIVIFIFIFYFILIDMTGSSSNNPIFSGLTLALLEDSGWYAVNYSAATPLVWGRAQGCNFVSKPCTDWDQKLGYVGEGERERKGRGRERRRGREGG